MTFLSVNIFRLSSLNIFWHLEKQRNCKSIKISLPKRTNERKRKAWLFCKDSPEKKNTFSALNLVKRKIWTEMVENYVNESNLVDTIKMTSILFRCFTKPTYWHKKRSHNLMPLAEMGLIQCDQKKSPNVCKSCPKMISLEN